MAYTISFQYIDSDNQVSDCGAMPMPYDDYARFRRNELDPLQEFNDARSPSEWANGFVVTDTAGSQIIRHHQKGVTRR
jgi:hypothetical protein